MKHFKEEILQLEARGILEEPGRRMWMVWRTQQGHCHTPTLAGPDLCTIVFMNIDILYTSKKKSWGVGKLSCQISTLLICAWPWEALRLASPSVKRAYVLGGLDEAKSVHCTGAKPQWPLPAPLTSAHSNVCAWAKDRGTCFNKEKTRRRHLKNPVQYTAGCYIN